MKLFAQQILAIFTLGLLLFVYMSPAHASAYQSIASIKQAIGSYLTNEKQLQHYSVDKIDQRLKLKKCSSKLSTYFPDYAKQIGRTSIKVSCNDQKSWKILVSVFIRKYQDILVSKHNLPTGKTLTRNDISVQRSEISRLHNGYYTNIDQLDNMTARRSIRAGKILSPSMFKQRQLVSRGDEVLILAQTDNLKIKVKGKALMNGFLGQKIKVKNVNSKRIFQATVISSGLVQVNM